MQFVLYCWITVSNKIEHPSKVTSFIWEIYTFSLHIFSFIFVEMSTIGYIVSILSSYKNVLWAEKQKRKTQSHKGSFFLSNPIKYEMLVFVCHSLLFSSKSISFLTVFAQDIVANMIPFNFNEKGEIFFDYLCQRLVDSWIRVQVMNNKNNLLICRWIWFVHLVVVVQDFVNHHSRHQNRHFQWSFLVYWTYH